MIIKQIWITEQSVPVHASFLSLSLAMSLVCDPLHSSIHLSLPPSSVLSRLDDVYHLAGKYTHLATDVLVSVCGSKSRVSFLLSMCDDGMTALKHTVDFLHI